MASVPRPAPLAGAIRLGRWHEAAVCATLIGLTVTGALWLVYHHLVPLAESFATHPAETWSLRLHGALAMIALVLLGTLFQRHVVNAWQRGRNRGSGGAMAALMALLTLTGYLLYYAGSPTLREWTSWLHWGTGLALPLLLVLHMALGGRWRR